MADAAVFSPADDGLSPNSGIDITMEETSANSEELLDDEGEEGFKIETDDLGNEESKMPKLKGSNIENAIHQVLGSEIADLENDGEQVLSIHNVDHQEESEHMLEFERNVHEINCEEMLEIQSNGMDSENATDGGTLATSGQADHTPVKSYLPPAGGMVFESYDDAYNYYNCYAKELGFGIRVKSSWTKRNSREKRGAVLCCNCEGFKTMKEACIRRKETRTGCLAMIRLRLVESNRWRLDEVKLEHNHLFDHQKAQNSRSHKKMEAGMKRKSESAADVEVKTIKLYRTPAVDAVSYGSSRERELSQHTEQLKRLKFQNGDVETLQNYFHHAQLADPNFFYVMDLNDEGFVRNVFWIESRSRAAYGYFGDVVVVDSTCLSNNYCVPLLSFSGLNHHGHSVLMGCGLLVDETFDAYLWLLRAWLTCMSGRPPQTIITDQCKALQAAVSEVFPRAHHCLYLPRVMQQIREKVEVAEPEIFQSILNQAVYRSMKIEEFESCWEEMIQHFAIRDHEWLHSLYEDRERWAPVYLKNSVFAGVFTSQPDEYMNPFFHGYLHDQMTLNEFFKVYEILVQKTIQREALDDTESREFTPVLRTRCSFEMQVSEVYTKEIFLKFQEEVSLMSSCLGVTQIHINGAIATYMVEERHDEGEAREEANSFEVVYDKVGMEVRCICCCFSFRSYLCRHALTVLKYNGAEAIPGHYILARWRKDIKRLYIPDLGPSNIDVSNPVQWFEHLYRRAMHVVVEGMASEEHGTAARQALKEALDKVRLAAEK